MIFKVLKSRGTTRIRSFKLGQEHKDRREGRFEFDNYFVLSLLQIKKLVYVYLVRYAEEQQDLALLSISTFQKGLKVSCLSGMPQKYRLCQSHIQYVSEAIPEHCITLSNLS